jgi:uncharacterized integral membrane protein
MTLRSCPLISAFCSLTHKAALEIESNALEKSTKVQYNFYSLEKVETLCVDNLHIYIKIFALLYVDDTIILAETPESLQNALNSFENYCTFYISLLRLL